ncbi:MAG: hypothetical protein ABSE43_04425 [Steroidobacteraceae bacterium]|jgi:hypothetical protein
MTRLHFNRRLLASALRCVVPASLALLIGCASAPKTATGKTEVHIKEAVALLTKAPDADSLAAAALLNLEGHPERAWPLMARAVAKAPERPDLVWLEIEICQVTVHCEPAPFETRLQSLDSANGFGWMGSLARATAAKDDAAGLVALAAIGRSERFDIYWTSLNARLALAAIRTKKMSFLEAQQTVVGGLVSRILPAYGILSGACKQDRLSDPAVLADCRGVANSLEHGDTYLTEMIGVQIAQNAWPENAPEWQAAAWDRKVYEYTSGRWVKVTSGLAEAAMAERYLLLCAQYHREQEVWRAQLMDAGERPDPPAEQ